MSNWKLIVREANYQKNLANNPGFEQPTLGGHWAANGGSISLTREGTTVYAGNGAMHVDPFGSPGNNPGAGYLYSNFQDGYRYEIRAWIKGQNTLTYTLGIKSTNNNTTSWLSGSSQASAVSDGSAWQQLSIIYDHSGADPSHYIQILQEGSPNLSGFYVDQFELIELGPYFDLNDDLGLRITAATGVGMPNIDNIALSQGLADGAYYQRSRANERVINLAYNIIGSSLANFHSQRSTLAGHLQVDSGVFDAQGRPVPLMLEYSGGATAVYCNVYYDAGFDADRVLGGNLEHGLIRFIAYDPYWYGADVASELRMTTTLTQNYILQRDSDGAWGTMGTGFNLLIYDLIKTTRGYIVAAGAFTTADGSTAYRVAYWDGSAWQTMGNGFNGTAIVLLELSDGRIVAGGDFTADGTGSGTYRGLAVWDWSSWSELGGGVSGNNGAVWALAMDLNGDLYVGGQFTTCDPGSAALAADNVALLDVSAGTWSVLGSTGNEGADHTGGSSTFVYALVYTASQRLIVGGEFDQVGGSLSVTNIARYNPATATWSAMGSGIGVTGTTPTGVADAKIGPDGRIYVGTYPARLAGSYQGPSVWTGSRWDPVGTDTGGPSDRIFFDPDGNLYSQVQKSLYPHLADNYGYWNGADWLSMPFDLPGSSQYIFAAIFEDDGTITLAPTGVGSTTIPNKHTITLAGNAPVRPVIQFRESGRVHQLINHTTNDIILFDLNILSNEVVTLDLARGTLTSNLPGRGNLLYAIKPSSNLATWRLVPGDNQVTLLGSTVGFMSLSYKNRYLSYDG